MIKTLAGRKLPYREEDASWIVNCAANIAKPADPENVQYEEYNLPIPGVIPAILEYLEGASREKPLSKELVARLTTLHVAMKPMEFYGGFDTPLQSSVVFPEDAPQPRLRTVGLGGIRVVFDWRYYLQ